ncbi:HAD-IA family hydrolase [Sinorhizobium sp. BJ1]|uniref:HAD-IA family hydrolase n=1 Tax=Sinorhizobium sp. BJ1 TaxID=2035455 RepID=UPI00118650A4
MRWRCWGSSFLGRIYELALLSHLRLNDCPLSSCQFPANCGPAACVTLRMPFRSMGRLVALAFRADDVPRGKPAPDLVLHAASNPGLAPDRCVFVEDCCRLR